MALTDPWPGWTVNQAQLGTKDLPTLITIVLPKEMISAVGLVVIQAVTQSVQGKDWMELQ